MANIKQTLTRCAAALSSAIEIIENGNKSVASKKMLDQIIMDYKKIVSECRNLVKKEF